MKTNEKMLQMPHAMRRRGLEVFVVDKYATRGANGLGMASYVYGIICHWIVSTLKGSKSVRQTLGLIINGHSTLPGPLANIYLGWDGAAGMVAAGRANHGGVGVWRRISGNQFFVGVEAEGPPFTPEQMEAYPKILAAIWDVFGQHPRDWGISHQEYAPSRKVDIGPAIHTIRQRAIYLVENNIFADTEPATAPELDPETKEYDMFFPYDPRFGVRWAIKPDFSSKIPVGPTDEAAVKGGWNAMGIKFSDNLGLSTDLIDLVPTVGSPQLTRIDGGVDVVGDGVGSV